MPASGEGLIPAPAKLTWTSDANPGIRRQRRGQSFIYLLPSGRRVQDSAVLQRIRSLAVPPAYESVWICLLAQGHLQATGRDARGRKQYRYHPEWSSQRGLTKFDRLRQFGQSLPTLRGRVQRRLGSSAGPDRETVLATLVRLLDTTWVRIGNDAYARNNGSFGLSTLRQRHAAVRGTELRLSFAGKSGVRHDVRLSDHRVAAVVRRCRELPGQELFQYVDDEGAVHRIDSSDVNAWLLQGLRSGPADAQITAKDFRTWHASVHALALTLNACALPTASTSASIVEQVAQRLRNTAAVCRKAYIHPAVLALSEQLRTEEGRAAVLKLKWVSQPPAIRGLTQAERQLMGLLKTV